MKKLVLNPGVCGMKCTITVTSEGRKAAKIEIDSPCPAVMKMAECLKESIDPYKACFVKPGQGPVYEAAENLTHGACPVPSAVLKCIESYK